jgi:hypothetical protein
MSAMFTELQLYGFIIRPTPLAAATIGGAD